MHTNKNSYTPHEYKTVTVRVDMEELYRDGLETFGWKLEKVRPVTAKPLFLPFRVLLAPLALLPIPGIQQMVIGRDAAGQVEMTFSRDKRLAKKPELKRLQAEFESRVSSIGKMEEAKVASANIFSLLIGFMGVILLGGAVFAMLANIFPLFLALACLGLACCAVTYFVYRSLKAKRTREVSPFIDSEYDTISKVCQKSYLVLKGA